MTVVVSFEECLEFFKLKSIWVYMLQESRVVLISRCACVFECVCLDCGVWHFVHWKGSCVSCSCLCNYTKEVTFSFSLDVCCLNCVFSRVILQKRKFSDSICEKNDYFEIRIVVWVGINKCDDYDDVESSSDDGDGDFLEICWIDDFVWRVDDGNRYAISYKNMTFRPGEINRSFVNVPHGATWAGENFNVFICVCISIARC